MSEKRALSLADAAIRKTISQLIETLSLAISVYLGFFWGFTLQQVDTAGHATLVIQVNNATNKVAPWVDQAHQAVNSLLPQTLSFAIIFVVFLLIPRLPFRHKPTAITAIGFPLLVSASWLSLITATLPAAAPQPYLSITTSGVTTDVNLSVQQIFTFLTFYRTYVVALSTLTLITVVWMFTFFIGWSRNIVFNVLLIIGPVISYFVIPPLFPIQPLTIAATTESVTVSGGGTVGGFPPGWEALTRNLILITFLLWAFSSVEYLSSSSSRAQLHRFMIFVKKMLRVRSSS